MTTPAPNASRLGQFQDGFAAALLATSPIADALPQIDRLTTQPGFAVYRNTVIKGCIDALQANYPAVATLVGEEWFRAAAALHVREHLPVHPSLLDYGDGFATFLDDFEPARELPYLADVARLDRLWTEAHIARDEMEVTAAAIARLSVAQLASTTLLPCASARWRWFADQPIVTIWERNRMPAGSDQDPVDPHSDNAPDIEWRAEGVLLTRPSGRVEWSPLSPSGCAFMDACARDDTLADAAAAALAADPQVDLAALMAQLLNAGAFSRLAIHES